MEPVQIIQGGKREIVVRLVDAVSKDPYDLSGLTALAICFQNADGTELNLTLSAGLSVESALLGKIKITLTAAQTALLAITEHETMEIALTYGLGTDPIKLQIENAYSVLMSRC